MTNKMTKKDYFNQILANHNLTEAEANFIKHEIELLEKKASGNRKPTKTQEANIGIKADIVAGMTKGERYTVTELIKGTEALADFSNQKISALLSQLVKDGKVVRTVEKGKTYFALADQPLKNGGDSNLPLDFPKKICYNIVKRLGKDGYNG